MLGTGPKVDVWIVRTVAGLITITGALLMFCAMRRVAPLEISLIAVARCHLLATISIVSVFQSTISASYLFDALLEATVALAWIVVRFPQLGG